MRIAVIPARGGSKRIPNKNIEIFCGKPIIAWSIQHAVESRCFDRVIVSTDDDRIACIAEAYGAEAPFRRPARLSGDYVATNAVISHAIQWLLGHEYGVEVVCCLYATAPFVTPASLAVGASILRGDSSLSYVLPVSEYPFPVQRAVRIVSGRFKMLQPEHFFTRSQDLETIYHDAGQFYFGTRDAWLRGEPVFGSNSAPLIIPSYRVHDIDTPDDWRRAELMFSALQAEGDLAM